MAACLSSIVKSSCCLLSKTLFHQVLSNATRNLYSPSSMGIIGYLNARDHMKAQFHNVDNIFFEKMKDFVENKEDSMIFTEDLKTMCHLVEKKPEDLNLLYKMITKFHNQNNLRFGSFIFGSVVMRTLYHLDEPDFALKIFKDPQLENFFDQITSYQLLMDLLYNHGKYAEVREVYDTIKGKNINGIAHPKNPFIIVMGACYLENTKESFDYAIKLFQELKGRGFDFPRRSITFLSVLALKQNAPNVALEVIGLVKNFRYIDIRCIKLAAYITLNRTDEILVTLRSSLQNDNIRRQQLYFKDTIEAVDAYVKKENLDDSNELAKILQQIKLHEYVQTETLHEHITATIHQEKVQLKPWQRQEKLNKRTNSKFNENNFHNRNSEWRKYAQENV